MVMQYEADGVWREESAVDGAWEARAWEGMRIYLAEHPITYDPLSGRTSGGPYISGAWCSPWHRAACCIRLPGNPRVDTSRGTSGPFNHTHRPSQLMAICGVLSVVGFCHSLSTVSLSVCLCVSLSLFASRAGPASHLQLHDTDRGADRLRGLPGPRKSTVGLVPGVGRD